jgi:hypothetical protein
LTRCVVHEEREAPALLDDGHAARIDQAGAA